MTRDEAIDALSSEKEAYIINIDGKPTICYSAKRIQALEMAIQALQMEFCEDAISREYIVEHIKACWTNGRPMYSPDLSELLSWIDDVPLVQPKPIECEDTISRQAAIDGLANIAKVKAKSDAQKAMMGRIMFFIERLPSVTPQHATCEEREKGECPFYAG